MKVKELIAALTKQDQEAEVFTRRPTHNYWGSILLMQMTDDTPARRLKGTVNTATVLLKKRVIFLKLLRQ